MSDDELKRLFDVMRQENTAAHGETRRQFDETATRIAAENREFFAISTEAIRHETQILAEAVAHLDEKLDRTGASLDEKIDRTSAETQAMIKFSHAELDRRVRSLEALEETVADLQARVERLESSTH